MVIWISWNIDIRRSLNSHDIFPRRKFQNRAQTHYRPGPILSLPTVTFEFHAKMAEETDVDTCSYGQLSEVQMVRDLDLDLDRVKVMATYTVRVGLPAYPTCDCSIMQFQNMAIWISWNIDIRRSLNSRDSFPRNSKIGLRQAVDQVPYYQRQSSLLSSTRKWWRR